MVSVLRAILVVAVIAAASIARGAEPLVASGAEPAFQTAVSGATLASALAEPSADVAPTAFQFDAGSWDLWFYGGAVQEAFGGDGETLAYGTAAIEYFLFDDIGLVGEFVGYAIDQTDPDAVAGGINILGRWHYLTWDRLALFIEGGAGIIQSDHRVPSPSGTHFNFTLHVGVGAKLMITDQIAIIGGARYFHLSNATKDGESRNPSIDAFGGYGGFSIEF